MQQIRYIHSIVTRMVGRKRKHAARACREYSIAPTAAARKCMQRHIVNPHRQVIFVPRIVAVRSKVRRNISRARRHWYRRAKSRLLPPRRRFPTERHRPQQIAAHAPKIPRVRARVPRALIKADPRHKTVDIGTELHPDFNRTPVPGIDHRWRRGRRPDRARTHRARRSVAGGETPAEIIAHAVAKEVSDCASNHGCVGCLIGQTRARLERRPGCRSRIRNRPRNRIVVRIK